MTGLRKIRAGANWSIYVLAKGFLLNVANTKKPPHNSEDHTDQSADKPFCGIVMPISSMDGCSASHWQDVKLIIEDSIIDAGFRPRLVSDADDAGVIQKRIIQNLYHDCIVVCDVSAKNPNVMFELGIRLAFNKPTIIIKDDKTDYSFDTSVIEHLLYPRDLRFRTMVEFKAELTKKIQATVARSKDSDYTTFLGHFGEFKVAKINEKEITADQFIIDSIKGIVRRLDFQDEKLMQINKNILGNSMPHSIDIDGINARDSKDYFVFTGVGGNKKFIDGLRDILKKHDDVGYDYSVRNGDLHLYLNGFGNADSLISKLKKFYEMSVSY